MKELIDAIKVTAALALILASTILVGHVFDYEYIGPEKRYEMDRKSFEMTNGYGLDYMSYSEWVAAEERSYDRMIAWADGIREKIAVDHSCLTPEGHKAYYNATHPDTRDGASGYGGENWNNCRD